MSKQYLGGMVLEIFVCFKQIVSVFATSHWPAGSDTILKGLFMNVKMGTV